MKAQETFTTLQFIITLIDTNPLVWRKLWVPSHFNFYQLHMAIKASFGWENSHIFKFSKTEYQEDNCIGVPVPGYIIKDARKVKLRTVFKTPGTELLYVYDLGDHWVHRIEFDAHLTEETDLAECIEGGGECPPEDVGGVHGYYQLLKDLKSETSSNKKALRKWLRLSKGQQWDPEYYNQREINKRMCLLAPEEFTFGEGK